jgi:transketolase
MDNDLKQRIEDYATAIRCHCVRMTNRGKSGHLGSMLSMADILAVLYGAVLKVDPQNPKDENRDRFILSKGHGGAAVYAALAEKGFFPKDWLSTYYQDNGKLSGHISHHVPGVEFSTGSLGHGLPVAVGMALAAKVARKTHRVFCLMSDGDCNEGSTWEAIMFAAQQKLDNLTVIIDYNRVQALGKSEDVIEMEPFSMKMEAFRWAVAEIDGHDYQSIYEALINHPISEGKPSWIIAKTVKCKSIKHLENSVACHYTFIQDEKVEETIQMIGACKS